MAVKHSVVINHHVQRLERIISDKLSSYSHKHLMEMRKMASAVQGLERWAVSKNPKETNEAHMAKIASAAKRLGTESTKNLNLINDIYIEGLNSLDSAIKQEANLLPNKFAVEIRQMFGGMNNKQKMEVLNNALESKDSATMAAILEAPDMISGLNQDTRDRYKVAMEKMLAPELYQQRVELNDSYELSLAADRSIQNAIRDGFDPVKLAEIEEAEGVHQEAAREFESAMSGNS